MESVFIVRQLLYQNDQNFARLDCEAVFSTFDAAYEFMLEELCWEEEGKRSLEWFRNEIVEYPLNKHIQAGYLSKRVYLTTGELHVDYDKIDESKPANMSLGAELTLGELVRIPPDYELPGPDFLVADSESSWICHAPRRITIQNLVTMILMSSTIFLKLDCSCADILTGLMWHPCPSRFRRN